MRIVFICTNYGSTKDGIGMYTKKITDKLKEKLPLEIEVIQADTILKTGKRKLFSFKIIKAIKEFKKKNINSRDQNFKFIIEYPFVDWNPLTILYIWKLKKIFPRSEVILSIHEYFRVNFLRRKATDILIKMSDSYIVTDEKLYTELDKTKILRTIPSNIEKIESTEEISRQDNNYCYFGLVNKSKAFDEMIEAWKGFNKDKNFRLNIYTASKIFLENPEFYNIKIFENLSEKELSLELQKNRFMILPIIPKIDENNGTLKAAALHGCIPIGIFNENISKIGIEVVGNNYTKNNLENTLKQSVIIDCGIEQKKIIFLKEYSEKNSIEKTIDEYKKILNII